MCTTGGGVKDMRAKGDGPWSSHRQGGQIRERLKYFFTLLMREKNMLALYEENVKNI